MNLSEKTLATLKDSEIPESLRASILENLLQKSVQTHQTQLERDQFELERKKIFWSTPFVATLAGLITLSATYIFDVWKGDANTENTITIEQLRSEIKLSETRLRQSFEEKKQKTDAELSALAEERTFQFNLVKEQLASKIDQYERAQTLLFLAKSGILSTLKVEYLETLANKQLKSKPGTTLIPNLGVPGQGPSWSLLSDNANARLKDVGGATFRLAFTPEKDGIVRSCSGFIVKNKYGVSAEHCGSTSANSLAIVNYGSEKYLERNFDLTLRKSDPKLGLRLFDITPSPEKQLVLEDKSALKVGMPLILIHYPGGGPARVSRCSALALTDSEIHHNCATTGGSSGGALLSDTSLKVVGFHYSANVVGNSNKEVKQSTTTSGSSFKVFFPVQRIAKILTEEMLLASD